MAALPAAARVIRRRRYDPAVATDVLVEVPKVCSRCGEEKAETEFYEYTDTRGVKRRMRKCKKCHVAVAREWHKRNPYKKRMADSRYARRHLRRRRAKNRGLTEEELDALEAAHAGRCAICAADVGAALRIDHDHATGLIRGMLCNGCNVGLGAFGDDPARLRAAAEYLEEQDAGANASDIAA